MPKIASLLALLALTATCQAAPEAERSGERRPVQAVAHATATVIAPVTVTVSGPTAVRGYAFAHPARSTVVDGAGVQHTVVTINFE